MVATRERERENASTSARARAVRKKSTKERLVSQRAVAVVGAIVEQTRRRREGGDRDGGGTRTRARRDAAGGIGRGIATRTFEKIPVPTDEREAAAGVPEEYRAVSTVLLRWHCDRDKLHVPLDLARRVFPWFEDIERRSNELVVFDDADDRDPARVVRRARAHPSKVCP